MKMIRNNETGATFVATDVMLKRVLRESAGPEKGKWSVLETEDKPKTGGKRIAEVEKPPKAEVPKEDDGPVEGQLDSGGADDEPKDTTGETLAALAEQLLGAADRAVAIEDEKKAKQALASIALENYGQKLDLRKAVDTLHQEVIALINGEDA